MSRNLELFSSGYILNGRDIFQSCGINSHPSFRGTQELVTLKHRVNLDMGIVALVKCNFNFYTETFNKIHNG